MGEGEQLPLVLIKIKHQEDNVVKRLIIIIIIDDRKKIIST